MSTLPTPPDTVQAENLCVVCDRPGGWLIETHGFRMHRSCAPAYWITDDDDRISFMAKVTRRRI